tara:strand:- start:667 stop:1431 length:765 start_codon:yes stop_codon:yes gene_type:complete
MYINLIAMCGLIFTFTLSATASATIISSYDAGAEVTISADFDIIGLETFLDLEDVFEDGGTGSASGSGDATLDLTAGDSTTVSAFASGEIESHPAYVESTYLSSAEFLFDNATAGDITGTVTFDLSYFASIFTDSLEEFALAYSSIVIGFEHEDDSGALVGEGFIFDEFFEFDSEVDGVGSAGSTIPTTASVDKMLTIGAGHSVLFYVEIDAAGAAESIRASLPTTVPEPSTLAIFALALMGLSLRKINKASTL